MPSPLESAKARTWSSYMTASLYQRGSSSRCGSTRGSRNGGASTPATRVETPSSFADFRVLATLAPPRAPQTQDVRRGPLRLHGDEDARPSPVIAGPGQEVVHLEALVGAEPQGLEIESQPGRLRVARIEAHRDQHHVAEVLRRLAVAEDLVVLGGMEGERRVRLQGGVLPPDAVDEGDELGEAVGPVDVPGAELVLLRVEVLLASLLERPVLIALEGAA